MIPYLYIKNKNVYFNEYMIVKQFVDIKWGGNNKKYYISKGYNFTHLKDNLTVDVRDLSKGSNVRVIGICPDCKIERELRFGSIMDLNHTTCLPCRNPLDLVGLIFTILSGKAYVFQAWDESVK